MLGLKMSFGWSDRTALNFVRVYEMSKSENFSGSDLPLNFPVSALYLLAAPNIPGETRHEIFERIKEGERMQVAEIEETIAHAKPDKAPKAKDEAKPAKSKGVNAKPPPDIVDVCVADVHRRVEDTIVEIQNHHKHESRKEIERLFAALADTLADLERKVLPRIEGQP
jgi:hypothetical protein